mmetsp:Transcript_26401/g.83687  ORF Transcript_26401/g.83687 Transcript_26401/m.83687 type:complete len:448 (+) Transcript_26401:71-1414(+)
MGAETVPPANSHGLWVPQKQGEASWYFIDANRAYRGPITKETLHFLYNTGAITKQTYVFTENLTQSRQWVRIKKVEWLHQQLDKPRAAGQTAPASKPTAATLSPTGGDQRSSRGKASHTVSVPKPGRAPSGPLCKNAAAGAEASNSTRSADDVPVPQSSTTVATPRQSQIISMAPANFQIDSCSLNSQRSSWGTTSVTGARPPQKLSEKLESSFRAAARPRSDGKGKRGWFSNKGKPVQTNPASSFGQSLDDSTKLAPEGVPEMLEQLRKLLLYGQGFQREGIFRVSPATSALKASRTLAEADQVSNITDLESAAQLIKVWFRELPTSILLGCVPAVVDGELTTGAECAAALQQLPEVNRRTIYWLLELIADICKYETENRMTAQSMVIVFAPNLISPPEALDPMSALEVNKRVVQFMELLFTHYNETDGPATRIGASPSMVKAGRA